MAKVLIIDDDLQILEILRRIYEDHSYDVRTASNGVEGIRRFREEPADLVVTDLVMPDKEGLETIQELKRDYPDLKIIAMSGGGRIGSENYLNVAELYGAERVFKKPFRLDDMIAAAKELLGE